MTRSSGRRGGQGQLVLNSLFHLDASQGNLPWSMYEAIAADPGVERAVPYALGDNFRGFRIIGTTLDAFVGREPVSPGEWFDPAKGQGGRRRGGRAGRPGWCAGASSSPATG